MQKGLRRLLVTMYRDAFKERAFYKDVVLHAPRLPFPAASALPALYITVMPWDVQEETNNERQNNFRISLATVLWSPKPEDELDLLKCDAADDIEECLIDLSRSAEYVDKFSMLTTPRLDTTPLSLVPFSIAPAQIIPPFGAIRVDTFNDFHYRAVTA